VRPRSGADHLFHTHSNNVRMKLILPWLKAFVDGHTLCGKSLFPKSGRGQPRGPDRIPPPAS
jgi:hypothetical protein